MKLQQWDVEAVMTEAQFRHRTDQGMEQLEDVLRSHLALHGISPRDVSFSWGIDLRDWCRTHEKLHQECPAVDVGAGDAPHDLVEYQVHILTATGIKPAPGDDTEEPG
jgi:hypothetical protein